MNSLKKRKKNHFLKLLITRKLKFEANKKMGKNKDKKKKGLGMEKTLAKTEKKIQKNIKKELEEIGEVKFVTGNLFKVSIIY